MSSLKKDVNQVMKTLKGKPYYCEVVPGANGHWRVSREGCRSITVANSPSDRRTLLNLKADIRRYFGIKL